MAFIPWTPEEDEVLRACYTKRSGSYQRAQKALPHRSPHGISNRAHLLGLITYGSHWTLAEDNILRTEWGDTAKRTLREKLPGRTWNAIGIRAKRLGLPSQSQGATFIVAMSKRFGCGPAMLLKVLDLAGVQVRKIEGVNSELRDRGKFVGTGASRKARMAKLPPRTRKRGTWRRTDEEQAEMAWRAWCDLEVVNAAALRRGLIGETLYRWLYKSGALVKTGSRAHKVLPSALIDFAVRTRGRVPMERFDVGAYLRAEVARRYAEAELKGQEEDARGRLAARAG